MSFDNQLSGNVRRRRSKAWIYYSVITLLILIGTISSGQPIGLLGAIVTGSYAFHIYRGGRFILWIW